MAAPPAFRTYPLGKLRKALPSGQAPQPAPPGAPPAAAGPALAPWTSREKTRFVIQVRDLANHGTALHYAHSVLSHSVLGVLLDNQLRAHAFLQHVFDPNDPLPLAPPSPVFALPLEKHFSLPANFGAEMRIPHNVLPLPAREHNGNQPVRPLFRNFHYDIMATLTRQTPAACPITRVYRYSVQPSLYNANSTFPHLRNTRYNTWDRFNNNLAPNRAAELGIAIANSVQGALETVVTDLAGDAQLALPQAAQALLVDRTVAFLSPLYVIRAELLVPQLVWNAGHPVFSLALALTPAQVQRWLQLVRPVHLLLRTALDPANAALANLVGPINPLPTAVTATQAVKNAVGTFQQWKAVASNDSVAQRLLLFLRWAGRYHRDQHALPGGAMTPGYEAILLAPDQKHFRTERVALDYNTITQMLLPALQRAFGKLHRFTQARLSVWHNGVARYPLGRAPWATAAFKRHVLASLFPGAFDNRCPVKSADTMRLRSQVVLLDSVAVITDGYILNLRVRMDANTAAWIRQPRIPETDNLVKIERGQVVPPMDAGYPGTVGATGYLGSLSRMPRVVGADVDVPGREVLGMDGGQKAILTIVDQHLPDLAASAATAGLVFDTAPHVKIISGRHMMEASGRGWMDRDERDARAVDAAASAAANVLSVDDRIDDLRIRQRLREGTDISTISQLTATRAAHWQALGAHFWNRQTFATQRRMKGDSARRSSLARTARFACKQISAAEYYNTLIPTPSIFRHPRKVRMSHAHRHLLRAVYPHVAPLLAVIVAIGRGQGSAWASGYPPQAVRAIARAMAIIGATVFMMPEMGTSSVAACSFQELWQQFPHPPNIQTIPHHNVRSLQVRSRRCPRQGPTATHTGVPVLRRDRAFGHFGRQRFCLTLGGNRVLHSQHARLAVWFNLHRMQACIDPGCPLTAQALGAALRLGPGPPAIPKILLQRDVNSATLMRYLIIVYIYTQGLRPVWNGFNQWVNPAQLPPGRQWHQAVLPNPNNPATYVR